MLIPSILSRPAFCRMRRFLMLLAALAVLVPTAQAQVVDSWFTEYHQGTAENGRAVAVDLDGNVLVGGWTGQRNWNEDYLVLKFSPTGTLLWARNWDGIGRGDLVEEIGTDALGNVYVTGVSWTGLPGQGNRFDIVTIKYDPAGNELWVRHWDGAAHNDDQPKDMIVDGAGNVTICGHSIADIPAGEPLYFEAVVVRYDTDGNLIWQDLDPSFDEGAIAWALDSDADGNIYVGTEGNKLGTSGSTDLDAVATKYSPDGTIFWRTRYDSARDLRAEDQVQNIHVDGAGNVYVVGAFTNGSNGFDAQTIKLGPLGNLEWVRTWEENVRGDWVTSAAIDAAGNVYVGITADVDINPEMDHLVISYDANGNERWRHRYDEPLEYDFNVDGWLNLAPDGKLYVALSSELETTGFNYTVLTYDPTDGTLLALDSIDDGEYGEQQYAAAFDAVGNVHFTGITGSTGEGSNVLTARFSIVDDAPVRLDVRPLLTEVRPGERLPFDVTLSSSSDTTLMLDAWVDAIKPDGFPYAGNPVVGPKAIGLSPGQIVSRSVRLRIPPGAPPSGPFTLVVNVGTFPGSIVAGEGFQFTVIP